MSLATFNFELKTIEQYIEYGNSQFECLYGVLGVGFIDGCPKGRGVASASPNKPIAE